MKPTLDVDRSPRKPGEVLVLIPAGMHKTKIADLVKTLHSQYPHSAIRVAEMEKGAER